MTVTHIVRYHNDVVASFNQIYLPCVVAYFIKPQPKASVVTNKGVL